MHVPRGRTDLRSCSSILLHVGISGPAHTSYTARVCGKDWWRAGTWNEPYWRMQKGCAVLLVMDCSQNTCSGHCTTELFRIRFSA